MKKINRITACLLSIAMVMSLAACGGMPTGWKDQSSGQPAESSVSAKPDGAVPPSDTDPVSEAEDAAETATISADELTSEMDTSSSMWELAQRIFPDLILYKSSSGKFTYTPINKDLPLCEYDWTNLTRLSTKHKEFEYVENGETKSVKGIDVSSYQGEIDWEKVAADGVKFAFIRLGYRGYESGKLVLDKEFEKNVTGAIKSGVAVGIYFVTQAISEEEAVEEADFVMETIRPYNITWPIVLDIEEAGSGGSNVRTIGLTAPERTDYVIAFCERVKEKGYTPMLYCAIRWFVEELELDRLTDYEKWFAQYFNRPYYPYEFNVWQYTNQGSVSGIKGNVDLNISMKDFGAKH